MKSLSVFVWFLLPLAVIAQYKDFAFERNSSICVLNNGDTLYNAWAGGLNSVKLSEINLNNDNLKDLCLFEKNGNKIIPFINLGNGKYKFAPQYVRYFPKLHDWAMLVDYNNDGKEDIFTYSLAGIAVYKNVSTNNKLKFELLTNRIQAFYYSDYSNLFASPDDYPVIADIDNDGDIDILNFYVLGKYVHFLKNMSVENSMPYDSLSFHLEDECWGHFSENADNNTIVLMSDCINKLLLNDRHTGSSMALLDYNQDNLIDMVIGDIDYPSLILLTNGGTDDDAIMVNQTTNFPNSNAPVNIFSMPAVSILDVTGNGIKDIVVSPSDPSLYKSENKESVWLYEYSQQTNQYELTTKSFLQNEMIDIGSGSMPVLFDINNDNLLDLFISNYGSYDSSNYEFGALKSYYSSSISLYLNAGTPHNPIFQHVTDDFGNLKQYGFKALYPAFGDLNEDGKIDMLCGNSDGSLLFFENSSNDPLNPIFNIHYNYQNITVGEYSTPQLFDIDNDGIKDLLIGNKRGTIYYYKNMSSNENPVFQFVSSNFGNIDVRDEHLSYFGFSIPCFFTKDGITALFCGSEQGNIFYYKQNDNFDSFSLILPQMYELDSIIRYPLYEGIHSSVALSDINNDGFLDLIIGNWTGGVSLFTGKIVPDTNYANIILNQKANITLYPNPANSVLNVSIENDIFNARSDIFIFDIIGRTVFSKSFSTDFISIVVDNLKPGSYFVKIIRNNEVYNLKFIKTN